LLPLPDSVKPNDEEAIAEYYVKQYSHSDIDVFVHGAYTFEEFQSFAEEFVDEIFDSCDKVSDRFN
jgi:hypothetical protein